MDPKIYVAVLFHDHQPVYRPGVNAADTPEIQQTVLGSGDADNRRDIYTKAEAYPIWSMPARDAHFGTQVSFTGALMQNLNELSARGQWPGNNWNQTYHDVHTQNQTALGNPRLDFVNFPYYHPLMGAIATGHDDKDLELQLRMHQVAVKDMFGAPISKGCFPAEMAFSEREIPVLQKTGVQWTVVDNIHIDRANQDYNNRGDGLPPSNQADRRNPGTHGYVALPNDLAKTDLVSPDALRPHYAEFVDPVNGQVSRTIVVPQDRGLSSGIQKVRDGSQVQSVIDNLGKFNTDPKHPLLVLLATDGDNNGSNSGEFHRNVPLDLATRYPGQVVFTTVQDYLDQFPPDQKDVIHVEDGSWWGANLGDPQFSKWVDDPGYRGFSPKRNDWAVLTAARNVVSTADALEPTDTTDASIQNMIAGKGTDTQQAWRALLEGEASDFEYWGPDEPMSYSPVVASNMAIDSAHKVMARHPGQDTVGPSIFLPMHTPYNPQGNFEVVTMAYDTSGVENVTVHYRMVDKLSDSTYGSGGWDHTTDMAKQVFPEPNPKPPVWVEPKARADEYRTTLKVQPGKYVQYYVEATDNVGNVTRSPIRNVWVNQGA
ncbi:MAG: hypothetical protein ACYCW6_26445 [Candidatus Xenobia bacterium]